VIHLQNIAIQNNRFHDNLLFKGVFSEKSSPMKILITGTICSGKTTLAHEFEQNGFPVNHEQARRFILEQQKNGTDLLPWTNRKLEFQQKLLDRHLQSEIFYQETKKITFFDTGFLDSLTFLRADGYTQEFPEYWHAARVLNYDAVFLLAPLPYQTDAQRPQSQEYAQLLHEKKKEVLSAFGYDYIEVPAMSVQDRCDFILQQLESLLKQGKVKASHKILEQVVPIAVKVK